MPESRALTIKLFYDRIFDMNSKVNTIDQWYMKVERRRKSGAFLHTLPAMRRTHRVMSNSAFDMLLCRIYSFDREHTEKICANHAIAKGLTRQSA